MKKLASPSDDFDDNKHGGGYTNRASASVVPNSDHIVPDRGAHPRRKVDFYDKNRQYSHSDDVRIVGDRFKKPHQADIKRNTKKLGGHTHWEIP